MPISPPQRLGDNFTSPIGHWENYDQYDASDRERLEDLKTITLRSIVDEDDVIFEQILGLSNVTMDELNATQVEDIGVANIIVHDENWTGVSSLAASAYYRNQTLLTQGLAPGLNVLESIMENLPIDITLDINKTYNYESSMSGTSLGEWALGENYLGVSDNGTDLGSWALGDGTLGSLTGSVQSSSSVLCLDVPDFPIINYASSYIELTSASTFGGSTTARAYINANRISGSGESTRIIIPIDEFENDDFDPTQVRGIRITIDVEDPETLKLLSVFIAPYGVDVNSNIRLDSLRNRIYMTPHGRSNTTYPDNVEPYSIYIPIMWRSEGLSGLGDPKPYDVEFGTSFYTGSMVRGGEISLYAREITLDPVTMVDLNGTRISALNGRNIPQYVSGTGFVPRTQNDLDIYNQESLDSETQIDLSRVPDGEFGSYAKFQVKWDSDSVDISMGATESDGYPYTGPALTPFTRYTMYAKLEETRGRILLYESDTAGNILNLVYDSGEQNDDNVWPRVRGRIGWSASLRDGDAYIDNIKDRKTVFGEYRSRPMNSITPVNGAQLFVQNTPKTEYFASFDIGPVNDESTSVTREGTAWRVSSPGYIGIQGIQSNLFQLFDLENSKISFDLKVDDSGSLGPKDIQAFLVDQYGASYYELALTPIRIGEWQRVNAVVPSGFEFTTGGYRLVIAQGPATAGLWYVDNVSVSSRSVIWGARPESNSPFDPDSSPWVPFNDMIGEGKSIQFNDKGKGLQVRGQVLRQDGEISKIQIIPKYAELGRIIDPADHL